MSGPLIVDGDLRVTGRIIGTSDLFEAKGVDFTVLQTIDLFTVAAGEFYIPLWLFDIAENLSGAPATPPQYKLLTDGPRDLIDPVVSQTAATNQYSTIEIGDNILVQAGEILQVKITVASDAATHTGRFIVRGIPGVI